MTPKSSVRPVGVRQGVRRIAQRMGLAGCEIERERERERADCKVFLRCIFCPFGGRRGSRAWGAATTRNWFLDPHGKVSAWGFSTGLLDCVSRHMWRYFGATSLL